MPVSGPPTIAPSLLAADFARLGTELEDVMAAGARVIHFDVMDGHFVPPISFGEVVAKSVAPVVHDGGGVLDVHLMVERPEERIGSFAAAGADRITIHLEATRHPAAALAAIRATGCSAGIALNPATPAASVAELMDDIDLVLCMTVNPGWGGQAFLNGSLAKIRQLADLVDGKAELIVDGGVDMDTVRGCAASGATTLVAGSAIFRARDPQAAYLELCEAAGVSARSAEPHRA